MVSSEENELTILQTAMNHAQSWFELHANQRQNILSFFLVAVAFLFNAYVGALNGHHRSLAGLISILGAIISLTFISMDLRNRDLTRAGEVTLKDLETRLSRWCGLSSIKIVESVDQPRYPWISQGKMIRVIYAAIGIVFIFTTIYAFTTKL